MTTPGGHLEALGPSALSRAETAFAANFAGAHLGLVQAHWEEVEWPGLVVGMAPGPLTSDRLPMFPWPDGSAGARLLTMSGMPLEAYLGRLRRANLCEGRWRVAEARETADRLIRLYRSPEGGPGARFVLCGRQVARAFELDDAPWFSRALIYGVATVLIPHPSGRCREYNDPANVARAREAVRWAARYPESTIGLKGEA